MIGVPSNRSLGLGVAGDDGNAVFRQNFGRTASPDLRPRRRGRADRLGRSRDRAVVRLPHQRARREHHPSGPTGRRTLRPAPPSLWLRDDRQELQLRRRSLLVGHQAEDEDVDRQRGLVAVSPGGRRPRRRPTSTPPAPGAAPGSGSCGVWTLALPIDGPDTMRRLSRSRSASGSESLASTSMFVLEPDWTVRLSFTAFGASPVGGSVVVVVVLVEVVLVGAVVVVVGAVVVVVVVGAVVVVVVVVGAVVAVVLVGSVVVVVGRSSTSWTWSSAPRSSAAPLGARPSRPAPARHGHGHGRGRGRRLGTGRGGRSRRRRGRAGRSAGGRGRPGCALRRRRALRRERRGGREDSLDTRPPVRCQVRPRRLGAGRRRPPRAPTRSPRPHRWSTRRRPRGRWPRRGGPARSRARRAVPRPGATGRPTRSGTPAPRRDRTGCRRSARARSAPAPAAAPSCTSGPRSCSRRRRQRRRSAPPAISRRPATRSGSPCRPPARGARWRHRSTPPATARGEPRSAPPPPGVGGAAATPRRWAGPACSGSSGATAILPTSWISAAPDHAPSRYKVALRSGSSGALGRPAPRGW